jgi:hypothetical protein
MYRRFYWEPSYKLFADCLQNVMVRGAYHPGLNVPCSRDSNIYIDQHVRPAGDAVTAFQSSYASSPSKSNC